jgi:hypothetical protein
MNNENDDDAKKNKDGNKGGTDDGIDALKLLLGAAAVGAGAWFLSKLVFGSENPLMPPSPVTGDDPPNPTLRGKCPNCLQESYPFRMTEAAKMVFDTVAEAGPTTPPKAGIVYLPFECYLCNHVVTNCGRCGMRPVKLSDPWRTCDSCRAIGDLPDND